MISSIAIGAHFVCGVLAIFKSSHALQCSGGVGLVKLYESARSRGNQSFKPQYPNFVVTVHHLDSNDSWMWQQQWSFLFAFEECACLLVGSEMHYSHSKVLPMIPSISLDNLGNQSVRQLSDDTNQISLLEIIRVRTGEGPTENFNENNRSHCLPSLL